MGGCQVQYGHKSLMELKMDPVRMARSVAPVDVDAWFVMSCSSRTGEA